MPQMGPLNWLSIFLLIMMLSFLLMTWWNFSYSYLVQDKLMIKDLVIKKWMW